MGVLIVLGIIALVLIGIGITFTILDHKWWSAPDWMDEAGVIFNAIGTIALVVGIGFGVEGISANIVTDSEKEAVRLEREAIVYCLEEEPGSCISIAEDVAEFNKKVNNATNHKNEFWKGLFFDKAYAYVDIIDLNQYRS